MSELSLSKIKQLIRESVKSTPVIRDLVNETAMQLLVDKVNELQKKVDGLEELQKEALLSLRVADKFCGQLTSDECSDSVHIPIQDAIRKIVKYQWLTN